MATAIDDLAHRDVRLYELQTLDRYDTCLTHRVPCDGGRERFAGPSRPIVEAIAEPSPRPADDGCANGPTSWWFIGIIALLKTRGSSFARAKRWT